MLKKHYTLNENRTEIVLNLETKNIWLHDDAFFRDIVRQCNLSEPIYFVIDSGNPCSTLVYAWIEQHVIPNLEFSMSPSLGYKPSLNVIGYFDDIQLLAVSVVAEPVNSDCVIVDVEKEIDEILEMDIQLLAVDIVKEPVNLDCAIQSNEAISTNQSKTTKKRKLEK